MFTYSIVKEPSALRPCPEVICFGEHIKPDYLPTVKPLA